MEILNMGAILLFMLKYEWHKLLQGVQNSSLLPSDTVSYYYIGLCRVISRGHQCRVIHVMMS